MEIDEEEVVMVNMDFGNGGSRFYCWFNRRRKCIGEV